MLWECCSVRSTIQQVIWMNTPSVLRTEYVLPAVGMLLPGADCKVISEEHTLHARLRHRMIEIIVMKSKCTGGGAVGLLYMLVSSGVSFCYLRVRRPPPPCFEPRPRQYAKPIPPANTLLHTVMGVTSHRESAASTSDHTMDIIRAIVRVAQ